MYQSFYNMSGKPFRLSPDPAFFFPSRGHKRALAYLRYGLHQNEGFVVITGAPGTGKTTLAQILLNEMNEKNVVVAHLTTTQLEADDMLRMVSASFGLRYENLDKAALLKNIESYLLSRSRENKRALLVIDEAQNLPMRSLEELRMLSNLQVGDKALLQTFLLGQAQFRTMLEDDDLEQLRQRVIANFHLGPLAADESQRYIESRLRHVGWNDDPAFAEIAFEKIHEYTEGVPRRINMLCDRILLFGCMEEQHNITGEVVDMVRAELEQEVGSTGNTVKQSSEVQSEAKKNTKPAQVKKPNKSKQKSDKSSAFKAEATAPAKKETSTAKDVAKEAVKASSTVSENTSAKAKRAEPQFPADISDAIDDESEQFIDVTQDFIDKFDATLSQAEMKKQDVENKKQGGDSSEQKKPLKKPTQQKETKKTYQAKNKSPEKQEKDAKEKPAVKEESSTLEEASEEDILGNTVKRKNPSIKQSDDDSGHFDVNKEPAQISERDLFRVIPGGKDNHQAPEQAEPATEEISSPAIPAAASATPTSEDVVLRRILRLVLAFHRSPSSFPGLDDPIQPLPEGVSELLELAVADDEVLTRVSPAAVMGISPVMLRAAVRFFIRRTLFANDKDHYRMLGLTEGADVADIERHYDLLMRLLRQDKQPGAAECVDKVGRSYERLMRFDDSPRAPVTKPDHTESAKLQIETTKTPSSRDTSPDDDKKAAAVLEALENPELTIDFSDDGQANTYNQPKHKPVSSLVGYGKDQYIPDPRITRRRIHLLGQAAILGIGALVVVLGIFITQLEPDAITETKVSETKPQQQIASTAGITSEQQTLNAESEDEDATDRRLGLSFNDGSADTAKEDFKAPANTDSNPKRVFDDRPASTSSPKAVSKPPEVKEESKVAKTTAKESSKPASSAIRPEPKKEPVKEQVATADQAVAQKFQPVPVAKLPVAKVPVSKKDEAQPSASESSSLEQEKFASVPITAKQAPSSVQSGSQQAPQNQFPGKDIPVRSANVTAPASAVSTLPVTPKDSTSTSTPSTATTKLSPIEAALSDSTTSQETQSAGGESAVVATAPAVGTSSSTEIDDFQLNQLLNKFATSYDKGDLNKLMQLFSTTARTNTQTTRTGIEREYKDLFNSTASRKLTLMKPLWSNEGRFASGVGQYSATIVPQGEEPYTANGKYTIQAYLDNGNVIISRFYFSNELTVKRKDAMAGSPTHADLKGVLSKFTRHYENADINNLMRLFANNAQTNDQNTLAGIRKDHEDLFNSTQQRQIFLKDVKWQIKEKTATGKGNFEVMVQSKGQDSFASVTGTVTIEVQKSNNGLKITKFLHKSN